jgi:WD40 repeat protein
MKDNFWLDFALLAGQDLKPELKIETESPGFARLSFAHDGALWAATLDNKLENYCPQSGQLLCIIDAGHRDEMQSLVAHPAAPYLLSGGYDRMLKVWDVSPCASRPPDAQVQISPPAYMYMYMYIHQ